MSSHPVTAAHITTATQTPTAAQTTPVAGETEYTLWAVLRRDPSATAQNSESAEATAEIATLMAQLASAGVTVRGFYDVSALRADADLMIWLHGTSPEALQLALRRLRQTSLLRPLTPTWNAMGVHRDAEFNTRHVPAYMRATEPAGWLTVYPFVRSYEWYLLPAEERRTMLADHGRLGAQFTGVLSNTVASFGLGDYEWLLALEADNLLDLVDLMRHLRASDARMHVREEVPFFTGRRVDVAEIAEVVR